MHCQTNFKLIIKRLLVVLIGIAVCTQQSKAQAQSFLHKFKPLAEKLSAEYQIPVAIILGVSIIESGCGKSRNCKLLNNYFGIVGKNKVYKTEHYKSKFKQYPNAEASFRDFCKKMSKKKFYQELKDTSDYHIWVAAMSKSGYSEYPKIWRKNILAAIKQYKLAAVTIKDEQPEQLPLTDSTISTNP